MFAVRSLLCVVLLSGVPGCFGKKRDNIQVPDGITASQLDKNLETLRSEREALTRQLREFRVEQADKIAALNRDRDELNTLRTEAETEVERLKKLLEDNKPLGEADKAEIQSRLGKAEQEVLDLNKKLDTNAKEMSKILSEMERMSKETKSLKDQIADLNTRIDQLQKDLVIARSAQGEVVEKTASASTSTKQESTGGVSTQAIEQGSVAAQEQTSEGDVSELTWRIYVTQPDNTELCWEFGSTTVQASLLGLRCVTPAPVRQQFKTESRTNGSLLLDQRTGLCVGLDAAATAPTAARVLLTNCKRQGETSELWNFVEANEESATFKVRNLKTGQCLTLGADRRISQIACQSALSFQSKP